LSSSDTASLSSVMICCTAVTTLNILLLPGSVDLNRFRQGRERADMSIVTFKKPTERVTLPDWYARTWEMRHIADTRQSESSNLRAEGRQLRNETALKTKWDTYHNDARLHDRYTEKCYGAFGIIYVCI
jgi:hypothetical protein